MRYRKIKLVFLIKLLNFFAVWIENKIVEIKF